MDYRWGPTFRVAYQKQVDAQVFGQRVEALRRVQGDSLTPLAVVDDARPGDSPIHLLFEWDDSVAAEEWRIVQARHALNSIRIVVRRPGEVDRLVIANINLREEGQHAYWSSSQVASTPELLDKAIQEALVYMRGWEARWKDIAELAPIFASLRQAEAQVLAARPSAKRRPRTGAAV